MLYKNVELFNVEEVEENRDGTVLYRFPKKTIKAMGISEYHKRISRLTTGIEIRFVGEAFITLQILDYEGFIGVYRGDYQAQMHYVRKNERLTLEIGDVHHNDLYPLERERYDEIVWRIVLGHDIRVRLVDIEPFGDIRPPKPEELPPKKMLAYGSSITHGAGAYILENAYIHRLARLLKMDVLNKGMGGSCLCETAVGDYIQAADFELLFLELGVNMLDMFSAQEFYKRASYIIKCGVSTGKPVVFVSPYLNSWHLSRHAERRQTIAEYKEACDRLAQENPVIYVHGEEILSSTLQLTDDMIHPSMYGHSLMADRLYEKIKTVL